MNAIGMLFQQGQLSLPSSGNLKQTSGEEGNSSLFQMLLDGEQATEPHITKMKDSSSDNEVMNLDNTPTEMKEHLYNMLMDSDKFGDKAISEDEMGAKWLNLDSVSTEIKELLNNMLMDSDNLEGITITEEGIASKWINLDRLPSEVTDKLFNMINDSDNGVVSLEQFFESGILPTISEEALIDTSAIQKELGGIIAKVETLLSQIETKQDIKRAAPKILDLLQQWTSMQKKSGNSESNILSTMNNKEGTKEQGIWRELVQSFQKRDQLAAKQHYNSDAKVTSSDITKWIGNALDNQAPAERLAGQPNVTNMPITRLEQHAIYLNQTQGSQSAEKQFIEQFQKIMQASKFSTMPNGTNQLSITMRPENLGEMMVRLTQVNGEMTVKILVTSQASKEMLESNMGQLRNIFSPQQVVIEKQELTAQQEQDLQKDKEEKEEQLKDQNNSHYQDQGNDEKDLEDDFETQFQELLNEKV
nr:flagellar hook-length control protein FliK [Virgibacillus natechei]